MASFLAWHDFTLDTNGKAVMTLYVAKGHSYYSDGEHVLNMRVLTVYHMFIVSMWR